MAWFILLIGFVLLIKGADWFVDGASSIAKKLNVSAFVIGITIVAFGTSAPEAAVSISAAITGSNEIALGNVIGSNIFNLLVVVGVSALFKPVFIDKTILKRDYPYNVITTFVLLILSVNIFSSDLLGVVNRLDGVILLCLFAVFMFYTVFFALKEKNTAGNVPTKPLGYGILISLIGIASIVLGGTWVVDSASVIAEGFGVSQTVIGLTIVAIGTSLPELVTSVVAAAKGEQEIALGNVIGSNIFNLLFVLGASTAINPICVDGYALSDILILLFITLLVYLIMCVRKKVSRVSGAFMTALYCVYMIYVLLR